MWAQQTVVYLHTALGSVSSPTNYFIKRKNSQVLRHTPFIPLLSLIYIVSSRPARDTQGQHVSKKEKKIEQALGTVQANWSTLFLV